MLEYDTKRYAKIDLVAKYLMFFVMLPANILWSYRDASNNTVTGLRITKIVSLTLIGCFQIAMVFLLQQALLAMRRAAVKFDAFMGSTPAPALNR